MKRIIAVMLIMIIICTCQTQYPTMDTMLVSAPTVDSLFTMSTTPSPSFTSNWLISASPSVMPSLSAAPSPSLEPSPSIPPSPSVEPTIPPSPSKAPSPSPSPSKAPTPSAAPAKMAITSITVSQGILDFKPSQYDYVVNVDASVTEITVQASAVNGTLFLAGKACNEYNVKFEDKNEKSMNVRVTKDNDSIIYTLVFKKMIIADPSKKSIYLAPSQQSWNIGVGDYGSEQYRMDLLADIIEPELIRRGYTVYRSKANTEYGCAKTDAYKAVAAEALALNPTIFVALHSNAFPGTPISGVETLTHLRNGKGEKLARSLQASMMKVHPGKDRGIVYSANQSILQLRTMEEGGIPAALIEIGYHDNPIDAQWLIHNMNAAAMAIVEGIVNYLN